MAAANKYLETYSGVYSEATFAEYCRRFSRMSKEIESLNKLERVSTTDPSKFTVDDVKEYIIFDRSKGIRDGSVAHDIAGLANLCLFCNGNNCVEMARKQYPTLFKRRRHVRLAVIERQDYDRLVAFSNTISEASPYRVVRATAIVMFALCAGLRTGEVQHSKVCNLADDFSTIFLDHVKGMDSWGETRTVPIRPDADRIMKIWLKVRGKVTSPFIFPSSEPMEPLVTNTIRRDVKFVSQQVGVDFDIRKTRRTYAQYLVDEGFRTDRVSIVLGHSNTKTTEQNYARPRDDRVVNEIRSAWRDKNDNSM